MRINNAKKLIIALANRRHNDALRIKKLRRRLNDIAKPITSYPSVLKVLLAAQRPSRDYALKAMLKARDIGGMPKDIGAEFFRAVSVERNLPKAKLLGNALNKIIMKDHMEIDDKEAWKIKTLIDKAIGTLKLEKQAY